MREFDTSFPPPPLPPFILLVIFPNMLLIFHRFDQIFHPLYKYINSWPPADLLPTPFFISIYKHIIDMYLFTYPHTSVF